MPESVIKELNLDLTREEKDILYEFERARRVMEVLNMPGWQDINDLALSKIDRIEVKYLDIRNITPEALWGMHTAVQYLKEFWNSMAAQLLTTGDFLKDPAAVQAMLDRAAPEQEDLEGELPNELNPMERFPEETA